MLAQLEQLFIVPKHVWQQYAATPKGKGLETYHPELHLPMVTGGAYTVKSYAKKGTTVFIPDPNYWGPPSHADAVALTYYTNADSMIADLKAGQPRLGRPGAVQRDQGRRQTKGVALDADAGLGDDERHVELEPAKAREPRAARPAREEGDLDVHQPPAASSTSSSRGTPRSSRASSATSRRSRTRTSGRLRYDCKAGNAMLDKLGYKKGANGIRIAPATTGKYAQAAHPMSYDDAHPDLDGLQHQP